MMGRGPVPAWIEKRLVSFHSGDLGKAERWFRRHGGAAVLLARLLPGVRPLVGIPAGMARMPLTTFLFYSTLGTLVWVGGLAFAGRVVGSNVQQFASVMTQAVWLILGVTIVVAVYWALRRRKLAP
jgi:membrane protein DedA with SNARE-associated domain